MAKFTDIFEDVTKQGTKIPANLYLETGMYPIIDQGQSQVAGYTNETEGLFTNIPAIIFGDHTRSIKYVDTPCFLGADGVKLLKAKDPTANYKYLYYALCNADIPNTGYNRHFKWLKEIEIAECSIEEQNSIVAQFEKIDTLICLRKQQLSKLDELVKSRFIEMFGDPIYNEKRWLTDSVENVCSDIYGGGTPSKAHPEYYENGDIPWVSSKDMKSSILYDSQIRINQLGVDNSTAKIVPINSVIMVIRSGILKHTLPVAINAVPITVNQDLKVFVPSQRITSLFLMYLFKMLEKDILSGVRAVTADNIEFNSLKERMIIVPPIDLQLEFVSFVEQTDKSKFEIQKSLKTLETLKKALMQKYFG